MTLESPLIDTRTLDDILEGVRAIAPFYAPEWDATQDTGAGAALLAVFAKLVDGLLQRPNQAPNNNLIAFLNMLGTQLLPAQPSRVPVTFFLSAGAKQPAAVPARSQVAASPPGGDPIIFETEKAILATPAKLQAVLSVVPTTIVPVKVSITNVVPGGRRGDLITDHLAELSLTQPTRLFDPANPNLQLHALYLGDPDLFNLKDAGTIRLNAGAAAESLAQAAWSWGSDEGQWTPFLSADAGAGTLTLVKAAGEIKQVAVNGIKSRWISAALSSPLAPADVLAQLSLPAITVSPAPPSAGLSPDAAFANDIPLPLPPTASKPMLPFGTRPRQSDTFYLASQEAFSKPGAAIAISVSLFTPSPPTLPTLTTDRPPGAVAQAAPPPPQLSWEYWNGAGWTVLGVSDGSNALTSSTGQIAFTVPADLQPTAIGGQANYWIRVRIAAGDYGQETFTSGQPPDTSNIRYPNITALGITYTTAGKPPALVLTRNNGAFQLQAGAFQPFVALDDEFQALYLGFDQAPLDGPISIFFSLTEQAYPESARPRVEWQYFAQASPLAPGDWTRLAVVDDTRGLTVSGTVQFLGPADFSALSRFGSTLFWVRAVDVGNRFVQPMLAIDVPPPIAERPSGPVPCDPGTAFDAPFAGGTGQAIAPAPQALGIYLNTAWAIQAQTIANEIVGSSDASQNQQYQLTKFPVVAEQIEIDEFSALFESERKALAARADIQTEQVTDAKGNVTGFWVMWTAVDDLSTAGPTDRVYAIDRTFGAARFGDGVNGQTPPVGLNNIRATYQYGGGLAGNVDAGTVKTLRTTIPFVDHVGNPVPAGGGSDTELVDDAIQRGAADVKNRGRAVSAEDYQWLARDASRDVARVLVLADFNDRAQRETNWVTVVIVPDTADPRPYPSIELRNLVASYLLDRAPNVTAAAGHVQVAGPTYVAVDVAVTLIPLSIDLAPGLETAAVSGLAAFLHPLTGGAAGQGWDFGAIPCLSDLYGLLEGLAGVDHVETLAVTVRAVSPAGVPAGPATTIDERHPFTGTFPPYVLIASGSHQVTVTLAATEASA
jgi:hypothetical protein